MQWLLLLRTLLLRLVVVTVAGIGRLIVMFVAVWRRRGEGGHRRRAVRVRVVRADDDVDDRSAVFAVASVGSPLLLLLPARRGAEQLLTARAER